MHKFLPFIFSILIACQSVPKNNNNPVIRKMKDSIGFATKSFQMDSVMARVKKQPNTPLTKLVDDTVTWKTVICPHDDYAYVGKVYPTLLKNIKAKTIILFGVAHKAKKFHLENQLVFGSHKYWRAPNGNVPVSDFQNDIIKQLQKDTYIIHDSMLTLEHSLEAIVPFLQYYNPKVEIVPVLVPYMNFSTINQLAKSLASGITNAAKDKKLSWGKDFAFVISSDAVHYGDKDWGEKNYAPYGVGEVGKARAVDYELEIIENSLIGKLSLEKIEKFYSYTVNSDNFKEYKWTWCGRYSIPLGLMTTFFMENKHNHLDLKGIIVDYKTSIDVPPLKVTDIGMGTTAPANLRHWVGYAAIGYK